ncbi:MAG TPA: uroporphyrinogen decarboxylase [Thermoanaerobaculia bacterium]|jgi:uroporphyrinogen decarboxylase|nr:uroporphyrinogen decarboxylase [Thermoanaerobaculia bacterium]
MNDLFLRACRNEPTERRPVWMMRQAGRYLPEYRAVRERVDFLTLCRTPELAVEVTLQPLRLVGVDAAIIFADILLPLDAMGCGLRFAAGDGPVFDRPVRGAADVAALRDPDVERELAYVFAALRLARRELANQGERAVPLIGFGGTPWTLAAYLVEGGVSKSHGHLLGWSWQDPRGLARLLGRLADVSVRYLQAQIDAGAQVIQLFDTWGGLLDARRFRELALPSLLMVAEALHGKVPLIYYLNNGAHLLGELAALPVEVLSVDWRLPLDRVREIVGPGRVLQGNLDPAALLSPPERIVELTHELLRCGAGGGHIVNLGHGILPTTPPEHARTFVATVTSSSPASLHDREEKPCAT